MLHWFPLLHEVNPKITLHHSPHPYLTLFTPRPSTTPRACKPLPHLIYPTSPYLPYSLPHLINPPFTSAHYCGPYLTLFTPIPTHLINPSYASTHSPHPLIQLIHLNSNPTFTLTIVPPYLQ